MENGENSFMDNRFQSNTSESKPNVLRLVKFSWERIICDSKIRCLKNALNESGPLLAGAVDFVKISSKMSSYTTLDEYLADVDCLIQSCKVRFPEKSDLMRTIESLSEKCHRDVNSIRKCSECFDAWTKDRFCFFTRACSKPHLLVFVKTPGNPLWPAKVMSVDGGTVNVEFFGDHSQADVPSKDCLLYSECLPGRKSTKQDELVKAKQELDQHIVKIKEKFGTLIPAAYRSVLMPQIFERQLFDMIPGAFDGSGSLGDKYRKDRREAKERRAAKREAKAREGNETQSKHNQHGERQENQSGDLEHPEPDLPPPNKRSSMLQSVIGCNDDTTFKSDMQHKDVISTKSQAPKRARKTFPSPMPLLVSPKIQTQMDRDTMSRKSLDCKIKRTKFCSKVV